MCDTILVMGAGTMGCAIAQVFAAHGKRVTLADQTPQLLDRARGLVAANLKTCLDNGLGDEDYAGQVDANLSYLTSGEALTGGERFDLVLESVFERADVKKAVYEQLDAFCRPDCIFCSNTSASNVFEIAPVSHPERFLITHWFNPAYLMELVEVVRGPGTSDEVTETVKALLVSLGKRPSVLSQYVPGFIVNRIANAICREAGYMISQGWTTGADIDGAIRATSGIRYAFEGPLALNDFVGWDLITQGCHDVYASLCNDSDTSALGEALVRENRLGLKTGQGVFDYAGVSPADFSAARAKKIIAMYRAAKALEEET